MLKFKNLTDEYVLNVLRVYFDESITLNTGLIEDSDDLEFKTILENANNWNKDRINEIEEMKKTLNCFGECMIDYSSNSAE